MGRNFFSTRGKCNQGKPVQGKILKKSPHLMSINTLHTAKGLVHDVFPEMALPELGFAAAQSVFYKTPIPYKAYFTDGDKTLNLTE